MKKLSAAFCLALLSLFVTQNAFAFSVSYDQTVSVKDKTVATIQVVVQDEQMWAQSTFSGMDTIVLRNKTGAYSYIPAQKMATKIPASMDRPNLTRDLPKFLEFLNKNGGKKIGSEKVGDKNCDIYQFTEPTLQKESKAWVWVEKQFPVKIEVPAPQGVTVVELNNIKFDPAIEPTKFDLPKDVKVIDLEALQKEAAAAPAASKVAAEAKAAVPASKKKA